MHLRHWFITDTKSLRMVGVEFRRDMRMVDREKSRVIDVAIFAVVEVGYMCGISRYFQWPLWLIFVQNLFYASVKRLVKPFSHSWHFFWERMKMKLNKHGERFQRCVDSFYVTLVLVWENVIYRQEALKFHSDIFDVYQVITLWCKVHRKCIKCSCFFWNNPRIYNH